MSREHEAATLHDLQVEDARVAEAKASCGTCQFAKVLPDPDPDDWFCDDDVKVVCSKIQPERVIAVGVRPYAVVRETSPRPRWCPLVLRP